MLDVDGPLNQQKILIYFLGTGTFVFILSVGVFQSWGSSGLTVIDLLISTTLTFALVILYFRQTVLLESQRDLLTHELNREARQQHTETLRERVRIWHGNPDKEISDDPFDTPGMNLPSVNYASFKSAPMKPYTYALDDQESFKVVPYQLEGDRYFQDLLENHAPDLRKQKEEIQSHYNQFDSLRNEFEQEFDKAIIRENEEYRLEPTDYFTRWIFEFLVSIERGKYDEFNDVREEAISQLRTGGTGLNPNEPQIWVHNTIGSETRSVYSAIVTESYDRDELREQQPVVKEEAEQLIKQIFDQIESEQPYDQIKEAASLLNEAAKSIRELEHLLIEYDGRPVYPSDCKYLEGARISEE